MGYLKVKHLKKACEENKYILVRFRSGKLMGINTKIADIAFNRKDYKLNSKTGFTGFIPCDFQTYITYKTPFIKSK
jgi:hypothetical protein